MQVRIGEEQHDAGLRTTSLVTIGYGASNGNPRGEVGAVGVLGPTRMDYASSMAAVNAVARYIGRFMDEAN